MNKTDLIRIHHAEYLDDIPFWISWTEGRDPILEVGCGHGRVTLPLLTSGREVVGLDIDRPAINSLREELGQKKLDFQNRMLIIHENIMNFQSKYSFGAVIIPCNTFSTFPKEERQVIISKIYHLLKPGGIFALSMPNPVQVRSLYEELREYEEQYETDLETSFLHPETGYPVQVSSRLKAKDQSLGWDWIYDQLLPDGRVDRFVQSTEHYLTTLETYQQELLEAGFDEISTLGDFDNSEYSEDSPYLILIGNKASI